MSEPEFFRVLLVGWLGLAVVTFVALFFVRAPYGRYTRGGWGPAIDRRLGWILMESPSAVLFALFYLLGDNRTGLVPLVFLFMWEVHYLHRSFVFPFRMRGKRKQMTLVPVLLAVVFNVGNAYLNGRWLYTLSPPYPDAWLSDPRFVLGAFLFVLGFGVNKHADAVLRNLRRPGETGYKIPHGGLYRVVSCPNYLGEVIEWTGWAIATWSLAGLAFAVWTFANLVPRAWAHHRWYRERFPDYPPGRKAVIPFLL